MSSGDLAAAWIALAENAPQPGDIRLAPLAVSTSAGPAYAGRDGLGLLHLLVPTEPGMPVRTDRTSRGVGMLRTELVVSGTRTTFLDVVCYDDGLSDVFERLAGEMLERVAAAPDRAVAECQNALTRWRDLLTRRSASLSGDAARGLFAELVTLLAIVEADPARRVDCWTGPTGAKHDFISPPVHLEVKATRRREGRFAEIHGVEQLQSVPGSDLYLVYNRVEQQDGGRKIGDLRDALLGAGADRELLMKLLGRTGWEESDQDETYVVVERLTYLVDNDFPRIVPDAFIGGGIPPGVMRLRYDVDLSGQPPVPLTADEEHAVLARIAMRP